MDTENLRKRMPAAYRVSVPEEHWSDLREKDVETLCSHSLARPHPGGGLVLKVFQEEMLVDPENGWLKWVGDDPSRTIDCPLLELMTLIYLLNATSDHVDRDMIGISELKDAHFFQGPHALRTGAVIEAFGFDVKGFKAAAGKLGGTPLEMADAAYRFMVFPKIPLYYLLWAGDEEFGANLSVLFDRSIERHLNADGIWGIVGITSDLLANGMSPREL